MHILSILQLTPPEKFRKSLIIIDKSLFFYLFFSIKDIYYKNV